MAPIQKASRAPRRNILLITTDQMRYDALACNGGQVAKTPRLDELAAAGVNYRRAHNQNVVCMPARATIITGQHVGSHGVWMNGVSLPEHRPTIAHHLQEHGYNTALLGKAHFEPWLGKPSEFFENRMASEGSTGPHRGFDHMELANHFFEGHSHYDHWMNHHPHLKERFYPMVTETGQNTASQGDTGAVQAWPMDVPREFYHTHWVAERTMSWLDTQQIEDSWFCWMSFPDPHHPWDVPRSELHRVDWREVPLPTLYSEDADQIRRWLGAKPKHWLGYYEGTLWSNLESPRDFVPANMTADQVREINALTHIENELIDDACGAVFDYLGKRGLLESTDIFFTTDHGELQGDFGLLFKGPYHTDALMRLPFIWRAASDPFGSTQMREVTAPVGHVDLAKTFCSVAGVPPPNYCEGDVLPRSETQAIEQGRRTMLTQWRSEHGPVNLSMNSIYHADGLLCTAYDEGSLYSGDEGELYDMNEDPGQYTNLWNDPGYAQAKQTLLDELNQQLDAFDGDDLPRVAPV